MLRKFAVEVRSGCKHCGISCCLVSYAEDRESAFEDIREYAREVAKILTDVAEGRVNPLLETADGSDLFRIYPTDELPRIDRISRRI